MKSYKIMTHPHIVHSMCSETTLKLNVTCTCICWPYYGITIQLLLIATLQSSRSTFLFYFKLFLLIKLHSATCVFPTVCHFAPTCKHIWEFQWNLVPLVCSMSLPHVGTTQYSVGCTQSGTMCIVPHMHFDKEFVNKIWIMMPPIGSIIICAHVLCLPSYTVP